MIDYEKIWVLEGRLQTRDGEALRTALTTAFPVVDDREEEGDVVVTANTARVYWRTAAPVAHDWEDLVQTIRTAAPDAVGTLTATFPYAADASPTFLVLGPDGVSAHNAYWAMTLKPFRRWPADEASAPPPVDEALDCPVCQTPQALEKRVNDPWNEIWVCTTCPAVLFAFHEAAQLTRLAQELLFTFHEAAQLTRLAQELKVPLSC